MGLEAAFEEEVLGFALRGSRHTDLFRRRRIFPRSPQLTSPLFSLPVSKSVTGQENRIVPNV